MRVPPSPNLAVAAVAAVAAVRREPCPWSLPDAAAAARFCRLLFGLEGLDGQTLLQELEQIVGLEHHCADLSRGIRQGPGVATSSAGAATATT